MLGTLLAVAALCVVIVVHEFGHYFAAVWTGTKVERFSVFGIGPPILRLGTWRGTEFVISAIPFGAYVMVAGMDPDSRSDPAPPNPNGNTYRDKPLWARAVFVAGGPVANYLFAILVFFGVYASAGVPAVERITVADFAAESAARTAGIEVGDELVRIGDHVIDPDRRSQGVIESSAPYLGKTVEIEVLRNGTPVVVTATLPETAPALGTGLVAHEGRVDRPFGATAWEAVRRPFDESRVQLRALGQLVTGKVKTDQVSGPVGIVRVIAGTADAGWVAFVSMIAIISTLLGLFNLLPLPALDGGRLAFLGYEAVARRAANPRTEEAVHGYGMLALIGLILVITVGDVRRMF